MHLKFQDAQREIKNHSMGLMITDNDSTTSLVIIQDNITSGRKSVTQPPLISSSSNLSLDGQVRGCGL